MKRITHYRSLILIALLILSVWFFNSRRINITPSQEEIQPQVNTSLTPPNPTSGTSSTRATRRHRDAAKDPLADVRSPIAKRYLCFMLPGGPLDGQSHDPSIVNNAFKQAWGVCARIDLTEEQQDKLAEFLMQEDWLNLTKIDPSRVDRWARENLSEEQRLELMAFIQESKQGRRDLSDLRTELTKKEYGVETEAEAFTAELKKSKRIAELLAMKTDNLPAAEVEKMRQELRNLMKPANAGAGDATARRDEHATQFFHLLADRIPLTEPQQLAIYEALQQGATPPTNPYDYQLRPADQIEAAVRANTAWMSQSLTSAQYETYLRHHLAEIEMIRFQAP